MSKALLTAGVLLRLSAPMVQASMRRQLVDRGELRNHLLAVDAPRESVDQVMQEVRFGSFRSFLGQPFVELCSS
jgi:hypothetical protein